MSPATGTYTMHDSIENHARVWMTLIAVSAAVDPVAEWAPGRERRQVRGRARDRSFTPDRFGPLFRAEQHPAGQMNAAGSMTRMPSHQSGVFGTSSVPRVTNRVRCSSSGYRPNCHTHSKSPSS